MVDKLISKLRYMGKQYATGMESRGGGLHKHYLEEAADELESLHAELETLRRERDELQRQLAGMTDSAKHFSNGMEYYCGLIDEAAKSIGIAMYTADDQGVHPDPLRSKLPECVAELVQQRDELVAALKLWKLASDNAEESELDDMACYCVPMPLFCDADEATEAALAKLGADKTGEV